MIGYVTLGTNDIDKAAHFYDQLDAFYAKAIKLGATDEGPAGPRGELEGCYAGYFRDLDGNKLNAFYTPMPS